MRGGSLQGSGSNPLENPLATITWNMFIVPSDYPNNPSVTVNYQHTCYPAHIIKVNGTVVYSTSRLETTPVTCLGVFS